MKCKLVQNNKVFFIQKWIILLASKHILLEILCSVLQKQSITELSIYNYYRNKFVHNKHDIKTSSAKLKEHYNKEQKEFNCAADLNGGPGSIPHCGYANYLL